jgi:thymidine kinase
MSGSRVSAPQCVVFVGPMGSGKSEEAMRWAKRMSKIGKVTFITSTADRRAEGDTITSRNGCSVPAIKVTVLASILSTYIDEYASSKAVVVDEAQFFDDWADLMSFVRRCLADGKDVCVAGLDTDANQRPFLPLAELVSTSTTFQKLSGMCERCRDGTEAGHTIDLSKGTSDESTRDGTGKGTSTENGNHRRVGNAGYVVVCQTHLRLHTKGS